jgi:hypothetical protein
MSKPSLNKSIEAKRLNPKTGVPLPGREVTIPFGAIVDEIERVGDKVHFKYLTDRYVCAYEVLAVATSIGGGEEESSGGASVPSGPTGPRLEWQGMEPGTMRAKVPGGWLVRVHGAGLAFVPDAGHEWGAE